MVFKDEKQLEKFLLQKCKAAVAGVERKVFNAIEKCLVQYYGQFTPEEYIRTMKLYKSLVKTEVKSDGKGGFKAEVYFDESALNYQRGSIEIQSTKTTGRMGYATWGAEEVLDTAMNGSHGGYIEGVAVWGKSMSVLGDINKLLAQELKILGVPIK